MKLRAKLFVQIFLIIFLVLIALAVLASIGSPFFGNYGIVDTVYRYDYATIQLQNGEVVEGKVDKWFDYENSDQIQVIIDGVPYLVHSSNCTLIGG